MQEAKRAAKQLLWIGRYLTEAKMNAVGDVMTKNGEKVLRRLEELGYPSSGRAMKRYLKLLVNEALEEVTE